MLPILGVLACWTRVPLLLHFLEQLYLDALLKARFLNPCRPESSVSEALV